MTAATVAPAPGCPAWCTEAHDGGNGWDEDPNPPGQSVKFCRTVIGTVEGTAEVVIDRYADLVGDDLDVRRPEIRVECTGDALTLDGARALAELLCKAAEVATSS